MIVSVLNIQLEEGKIMCRLKIKIQTFKAEKVFHYIRPRNMESFSIKNQLEHC